MKSLIKFFPVAVGVLALASCSNDDFFGSSSEDGKLELVATVAAPVGSDDGLTTRSVISPAENVADYSTSWEDKDAFRVYDAQLQKYDAFSFKAESGKITIDTNPAKVTEYAKAIFPGESVSYAGWDADNDAVTATVKIGDGITYEPAKKVGDKTAYVSNLPMWGDATMNEDHLSVNLNPLTAYTDITVNALATTKVRVISAKETSLDGGGNTIAAFQGDVIAAAQLSTKAPLTGYFDALLKTDYTDSYLVADYTDPLYDKYGYIITVDLAANTADEAHVFIPIVPQTYEYLVIQYWDGGTNKWVTKKEYKNQAVGNNIVLRKGLEIGDAIVTQDAKISKFEDINTRLTTFNNGSYAGVKVINIDLADGVAADAIKTSAGKQTITIPDFTEEKIINLNFDIDDTGYALTIDNNNSVATVLNLKTIKGSSAVTLMQGNGGLTITGEINSTGTGESKRLIVGETGALTLGLDDFGPFKTDMNLYLSANVSDLTIAAADGNTIAAIDASAATNASVIDVVSGTVTAIGGTTAAATPVTVEADAVVGSVKATTAAVTVKAGATATSITTTTGTVTVIADATVSTITTGDAKAVINAPITSLTSAATGATNTITATANIGTLKLAGAAPKVILTGATAANKDVVKIEALQTTDANNAQAVTLTSTDKAAVGTVTLAKSDDAINATSSITASKAADIKTDYIGTAGEIYTAAQLAGVTTGKNYKLMVDIDATGTTWAPVNLNGTFDGKGKTITALGAPLFGTISGGTVKKLNLTAVAIDTDAANQGALAQTVSGTTTINEITVAGTIGKAAGKATTKNIGGLIGTANGTVTLDKNQVTATVQGYANVGGFIGNVAGGSVTFKANGATVSAVTFKQTFTATAAVDMNEGTFGNFIGSITGEGANVTIGGKTAADGATIAAFVNDAVGTAVGATNISFSKNKVGDPAKTYKGMKTPIVDRILTYEIGYSPVQAVGTVLLYGAIEDELGNPIAVTINHINQY